MTTQPPTAELDAKTRADRRASELARLRFLSCASHDVRQPMHALSLYLSALERRIDAPDACDIIHRMRDALSSMTGTFSTLEDYVRAHAEAETPQITDFPLQDVLRSVAAGLAGAVEVDYSALEGSAAQDGAAMLRTDAWLFECAMRHLVSNAVKHGGGWARIAVEPRGAEVAISVTDRGRGIAPGDQERAFEEFVRLEGSAGEGLGLGLTIVKRIAEGLAMPIQLSSSPGQGAGFTLYAPLSPR